MCVCVCYFGIMSVGCFIYKERREIFRSITGTLDGIEFSDIFDSGDGIFKEIKSAVTLEWSQKSSYVFFVLFQACFLSTAQ